VIVVVDYDAGNIRSVETALTYLGVEHQVSSDPQQVRTAERVIFPGVGDGAHAMTVLRDRGLDSAITDAASNGVPILGICVGCQVVFDRTEERDAACLGLVPGTARRFPDDAGLKVPHIGWNSVEFTEGHWLFRGVEPGSSFYFVHSYYPSPQNERDAIAWSDYGGRFAAAVERGSLVAVQFHPEKSGEVGLKVLANFVHSSPGSGG
jgi:glutamine amidotransferase